MFVLVPVKPFTARAFLKHDLIIAFLCLKKCNGSHRLSIKSKPIKVPVIWLPPTCPQSHLDTHSPTYIQCLWFPLFSHASAAVHTGTSTQIFFTSSFLPRLVLMPRLRSTVLSCRIFLCPSPSHPQSEIDAACWGIPKHSVLPSAIQFITHL